MTIIMHLNLLKLARKPNDKKKKKNGLKKKEKNEETITYFITH